MKNKPTPPATVYRLVGRIFHPNWISPHLIVGLSSCSVVHFFVAVCHGNAFAMISHGVILLYSAIFFLLELYPPNSAIGSNPPNSTDKGDDK